MSEAHAILLAAAVCFALVGLLLYLPLWFAGVFEED